MASANPSRNAQHSDRPPDPTRSEVTETGDEIAHAALALLGELETSLRLGQQAVLARDVADLDRATAEQIRLRHALSALLAAGITRPSSSLAEEMHSAACRVLHLTRVQDVLLRRAEQFLSMLTHLAAGPGATYQEIFSARAVSWPATARPEGEPHSCRV